MMKKYKIIFRYKTVEDIGRTWYAAESKKDAIRQFKREWRDYEILLVEEIKSESKFVGQA